MHRKQKSVALIASAGLLLATLTAFPAPARATRSGAYHAYALADLVAEIVECSVHPCLGDREEKVRQLLRDQILEGDCDEFSDITVAYPMVAGKLQGIAELDLDGGLLDDIYLLLTNFHAHPTLMLSELERILPDCECEMDSDEGDPPAWTCSYGALDDYSFEIDFAVAPGLAYVNIY
jgi:hypothetical protein